MAQRTGAEHLLAPAAKTRSAAIAALLVAALLALSGCGGDSEDSGTAGGTQGSGATAQAEGNGGNSLSSPSASTQQGQADGQGTSQGQAPQGTPAQGKGKQGQRIVLPKGSPEPGPTPAERAEATVADISLTSPVLPTNPEGAAALPSTHTCAGKEESPPLRWSGIPAGTEELALFAMNTQPVDEKLFFDWAVAGIDPASTELEAGKLPKGAIVGRNDFGKSGYSLCPPQGGTETYIFALYALPERLNAKKGFDPFALRTKVLEISGNVGLLAASAGRG